MRVGGALVGSWCDVSRHKHPGRSYSAQDLAATMPKTTLE